MGELYNKAKKAIAEHPGLFKALEEYDRTGTLRKSRYKVRVNFTIDEALFSRFRDYCRQNGMSMSAKVEQCLGNIIKDAK